MGQTTPYLGIYIPAAGETGYDAAFAAGMMNIDQHDHSGGPNKGVPITGSGLADFSVTFDKLNSNVVDVNTGIGTQSGVNQNRLQLLGYLSDLYQLSLTPGVGFVTMNGGVSNVRTFQDSASVTWTNANGTGDPQANVVPSIIPTVTGTADQIVVTPSGVNYNVALAPNVVNATQPCFHANAAAGQSGITTATLLQFNTTEFNQGSHYSTATHLFTAPKTGIYLFVVRYGFQYTGSGTELQLDLYKNGSFYDKLFSTDFTPNLVTLYGATGTEIMNLTAGDTVSVYLTADTATNFSSNSSFQGILLC